ncbi:hypothetical protein [Mycobacterium colombiense]|uniref:hypothetical protein n=1 Tax=Mycobacterium colombiense TaxID=339268 RepID=UPI001115560A|nr:hypothetical protein [Mycobacterium colombiense]
MVELPDEVEQQLASMSDADWDVLVAKVRAPDQAEAFRDTASKWISGDRLDAVCAITTTSLYLDDDGNIDAGKVERQLRALFDDIPAAPAGPRWQNHGQFAPEPPTPWPGDNGNAEAQRRFHGAKPPTGSTGGLTAAQKRFGTKQGDER